MMKSSVVTTSLLVASTISLAATANTGGGPVEDYCPVEIRRRPWGELSSDDRVWATVLGYIEGTWNYELPYYNLIEDMWYTGMNETHQAAAGELGYYTEDQWDCCVNHYWSYDWEDLVTSQPDALAAFEVFGWNQTISDSGGYPPHWQHDYWYDLDSDQREAAAVLCYTQEMWDVVSLTAGTRRRRELLGSHRRKLLRSRA